ncbi:MAG TPA: hypothetical protein VGK67_09490 [Myxococcales bacterium]|jgi:hypothetical protein
MNRLLPVALSLLALLATACPEENNNRGPDAALAGLDAAAEAPDAEAMPPDAEAPGPDAGSVVPPLRTLLAPHLMGTAPADNLVMAPNFDPMSEQWYAVTATDYADAQLIVLPKDPVNGLPVFKLLAMAAPERYLMGTVRGGKGPLQASVWIGRDAAASPDLTLDVVIQGLTSSEPTDSTFVLAPEPDSEQTIDRIRWVRYSARIDQELLGFGSFIVYDQTKQVVYVLAPALTPVVETRGLVKAKPSLVRKPTAGEAKAVKDFWEKQRRRTPPRPPKP